MTTSSLGYRLPNVTVKQLQHFVVAAETGKLAEAARVLHLAPSAISHSIDQLESTLGVRLCIRHKAKGLVLTPSGESALGLARTLLAELDDFEAVFTGQGGANSGRLLVGCNTAIAPLLLPATQSHFITQYPNATVEFFEDTHEVLQDRLLRGSIDVAFMYDVGIDHRLEHFPLFSMAPSLVLPSSHPLAAADGPSQVPLEAVADEPFVLLGTAPMYEQYLRLFAKAGVSPRIAHTTRSMATLRAFVGRGGYLGLSYEQYALAYSVDGFKVAVVPLDERSSLPLDISLVLPHEARPSLLCRQWMESAREVFSGYPNT